jgi:hypothetical protein
MDKLSGAFQMLFDLANRQAGNLELAGGLGPQSKTATQDKLLNANAGAQTADLQDDVVNAIASAVSAMLWYAHHDPKQTLEAQETLKGTADVTLTRTTTPEERYQVPFESMQLTVDPYSLMHQTPQQRLEQIQNIVQQVVVPMMPILQQSGIRFDVEKYLQKIGEYADIPDLDEIITIGEPVQQGGAASPDGQNQPAMPGNTTRTYNRVNTSEATQPGQRQAAITSLLSGKNQGGSPNGKKPVMGAA